MSKRFTFDKKDKKKWIQNTLIFSAPAVMIYLFFLKENVQDGLQVTDFYPNAYVLGVMSVKIIDPVIDFWKKYLQQS